MSPEAIANKRKDSAGYHEGTMFDDKEGIIPLDPAVEATSHVGEESNSLIENTAPSNADSAKRSQDGGSDPEPHTERQPRQSSPSISDDDELNDDFPEYPGAARGKPTTIVASKPKPRPKRLGDEEEDEE